MKPIILITFILLIPGCFQNSDETRIVYKHEISCDTSTKYERALFILSCIENANPMSDEEPEDWIKHCKWMAEETLCAVKKMKITQRCGDSFKCHWRTVDKVVAKGEE